MKQNIAFGLTLNANHVSTAERAAIRGHYIKGWAEANDSIAARARKRWRIFRKGHHKQTPMADITESFKAQKMLTSKDWKRMYSGGTCHELNWLQQSTDFFMANAGIKDFTPASK